MLYFNIGKESSRDRWPIKEGSSRQRVCFGGTKILLKHLFLEQRLDPGSVRHASRHTAPTKLSPSSARHASHFGRASSSFPSLPYVPSGYSQPANWADLVCADPRKAHDCHSLEMSSRIGGRSRIEGAVPARRVKGQDTTPEPVSVEQDFAGEDPESVEEDFARGEPEPSAEDFCDGLSEQDTAGGLEHQVNNDQFQAFISRLSMAERLRVLGVPEVHAVRPPVKTPSIRSAVELSNENPGSGSLPRGKFLSAAGGCPFSAATRKFAIFCPVKFHAPL